MRQRVERSALAAAGAGQGAALWLLVEHWPEAQPGVGLAWGLATALLVSAAVGHFAWTGLRIGRLLALAAGTGLVYGLVGVWVGSSFPETGTYSRAASARSSSWLLACVVTLYALGPFLQVLQRTGRPRFPYEELFRHGWRNVFVAVEGAALTGLLWMLLAVWARLFELIGIRVFESVFFHAAFAMPATGAALAFGVSIGREGRWISAVPSERTRSVFRGLLALVGGVGILFLAALPVTGLEPLWETRRASPLLLGWVTATVFLLNAAYQDGHHARPRPVAVRRLVEAALLATTGFVALSAWGLWLRIDQHGLTPQRFWGVVVWLVLSVGAVGYGLAVARRGEPWLRGVRTVNRGVAALVVGLGLLTHTPVLDPVAWSARSQHRRLLEGDADAATFDYGYLRFQLGREGRERFERLAALEAHPERAAILDGVARARAVDAYWEWREQQPMDVARDAFEVLPPGAEAPDALLEAIRLAPVLRRTTGFQDGRCAATWRCALFPVRLSEDLPGAWVMLLAGGSWHRLEVFARDDAGRYRHRGRLHAVGDPSGRVLADLRAGRYDAVPARIRDLVVGDARYRFEPSP